MLKSRNVRAGAPGVNDIGPVRIEDFLEGGALIDLDIGRVLSVVEETFGPVREFRSHALSLAPGEPPPQLLPVGAAGGFLFDLGPPDWRSEWGGLLLFQREGQAIHGYRPVPGTLTLFRAAHDPLISLIIPQGKTRTSILGWWL